MSKQVLEIDDVFDKPGALHHVVKANGFLFLTSQISADLATGKQSTQCTNKYFLPGQEPAKVSAQTPSLIAGIDIEIEATAIARG